MANTTITPLVGVISLSNFLVRDNFNRANENPLTVSKWTTPTAQVAWKLVSLLAVPTSVITTDNGAFDAQVAAANWPADQYAQANLTVTSTGGGAQGVGLKLRQSTSAQTYYRLVADHAATNNVIVQKFVAGTLTTVIAAFTKAWADGALWRFEILGSTLRIFLNNLQIGQGTDATITSGVPGIELSTNVTSASLGNFEAGRVVGPLVTRQTVTARVPTVGAVTITGVAPVVTQGGASDTGITPTVATITLAGTAATLTRADTITPAAGSIGLTGNTVGEQIAVTLTPGVGALNLSSTVASVVTGSGRSPDAGTLAVSGNSPALLFGNSITPTTGSTVVAGLQAQVQRADRIAPNPGTLSITGFPVSLGGSITITPAAGVVTLTGASPVVSVVGAVTPQTGALALTGGAVNVTTFASIIPGTGSITLTASAPALFRSAGITPNSAAIGFSGLSPSLSSQITLAPSSGRVDLTGNAPAIGTSGVNITIRPNPGSITLTGSRPHIPAVGPDIQDGQGDYEKPYKFVEPVDWQTPMMLKQIAHLRSKQYLGALDMDEEMELVHLALILDEVT